MPRTQADFVGCTDMGFLGTGLPGESNVLVAGERGRLSASQTFAAAQQTRFDFAQNYDISTINAKKSVLDGIGHVAAICDNDRLIVDQRCHETLISLDQYQWDPNPNLLKEKPKHNMASHMADALRYALYSFETSVTSF